MVIGIVLKVDPCCWGWKMLNDQKRKPPSGRAKEYPMNSRTVYRSEFTAPSWLPPMPDESSTTGQTTQERLAKDLFIWLIPSALLSSPTLHSLVLALIMDALHSPFRQRLLLPFPHCHHYGNLSYTLG